MIKKIIVAPLLVFFGVGCAAEQPLVDDKYAHQFAWLDQHELVEQRKKIHGYSDRRYRLAKIALAGCAVVVGAYAAHELYLGFNPQPVSTEFLEKNFALFKALVEAHKGTVKSTFVSCSLWIGNVVGVMIVQSLIAQAVAPLYSSIKNNLTGYAAVPLSRSWFLSEQVKPHEVIGDKKLDIPQELVAFLDQLDAVIIGYQDKNVTILRQAFIYLISHIGCVKDIPCYQSYQLKKIENELDVLGEKMIFDAQENRCQDGRINEFKDLIRRLYSINPYRITQFI